MDIQEKDSKVESLRQVQYSHIKLVEISHMHFDASLASIQSSPAIFDFWNFWYCPKKLRQKLTKKIVTKVFSRVNKIHGIKQ